MKTFRNRAEAGRLLAQKLRQHPVPPPAIVLALPRGGVPVGFEVAHALQLPLDLLVVRKLGVPGREELAMGAVASGGAVFRNERVIDSFHITPAAFGSVLRRESLELARRERLYRGARRFPSVKGRTVILVDDGIATGSTVRAALQALAAAHAAAVVVAAPVIAADTAEDLRLDGGVVVAVQLPEYLNAIGQYYDDFRPTSDDEVCRLLAACTTEAGCPPADAAESSPHGRRPAKGRAGQVPLKWCWHYRTLLALRNHLLEGGGDRMREPVDAMEPPSIHGVDFVDELYDRDLLGALPANPDAALAEINDALQRLERGTYGRCEVSGRGIAEKRLRSIPWCRTASDSPVSRRSGRTTPSHAIKKKTVPLG